MSDDDGMMMNFTSEPDGRGGAGGGKKRKRVGFYEAKKKRLAATNANNKLGKKGPRPHLGQKFAEATKPPGQKQTAQVAKTTGPSSAALAGAGARTQAHPPAQNTAHKAKSSKQPMAPPGARRQADTASAAGGGGLAIDVEEKDEEEDIMAAVSLALSRDKALESDLVATRGDENSEDDLPGVEEEAERSNADTDRKGNGYDSESEAHQGTVSFVSGTDSMKLSSGPKHKNKSRDAKAQQQEEKKKKKAEGIVSIRSRHGVQQVPPVRNAADLSEEERLELFGELNASSFRGLGLAESLCSHLEDINFSVPTKTQVASIPWMLKGRDALVNAPTGSGKTLAYLAPVVHSLQDSQDRITRDTGTHAIIIAPTRELVVQINDVLLTILRRYHWLVGGLLMGGEQRTKEKARLRKGVTVLTATPGRLLDHLQNTQSFRTTELKWLIMDEADRLLDLGFEKKMEEILGILDKRLEEARSGERQTVLLSATMHNNLGHLATLSLRCPVSIGFRCQVVDGELLVQEVNDTGPAKVLPDGQEEAAGEEDATIAAMTAAGAAEGTQVYSIPSTLKQQYMEIPCKLRTTVLLAYISSNCDTVDFAFHLATHVFPSAQGANLTRAPILKLHGNMPQGERYASYLEFQKAPAAVLLCTDVASRGLDFPNVTSILQFDPPGAVSEYVHRVGRTARMGRKGESMLFLLPSEMDYLGMLRESGADLEAAKLLPFLDHLPPHREMPPVRRQPGDRPVEHHPLAQDLHQRLTAAVAKKRESNEMAQGAFRTFVRAYSTHPRELKPIFHPKRLHLGHLATSFCLRDTPTMMGQSASKAEKIRRQKEAVGNRRGGGVGKHKPGQQHTGSGKLKMGPRKQQGNRHQTG